MVRSEKIRVAVIGAGAAGLCAARHMLSEPSIFEFCVFEQEESIGGTWVYTEKVGINECGLPIHSSMYENLRTNLPKEVMAFPDFPFPHCDGRSFIHHTEVLKYLQDYSEHYGLHAHIKLHTVVENVQPISTPNNMVWSLKSRNLVTKDEITEDYDAVMVCTGHYSVPYIPQLSGLQSFKGLLLHSHEYRNNKPFKDLKVVILGAGASGIDIALEIAAAAKEVILSHNLPLRTCPLPVNLSQEVGLQSIQEKSVTFLNGKTYACDAILLCTGYLYTYPFLHKDCNVIIGDQRVQPLFKHLFHVEHPTLGIWGIPKQIAPFPIFDQQVLVFLKYLKGEITLPCQQDMIGDTENDFQKRLESGMKARHAHTMPKMLQWEYDDELSKLGRIPPIPDVVRNLFSHVHHLRKQNVMNYKNVAFKIIGNTTFTEI